MGATPPQRPAEPHRRVQTCGCLNRLLGPRVSPSRAIPASTGARKEFSLSQNSQQGINIARGLSCWAGLLSLQGPSGACSVTVLGALDAQHCPPVAFCTCNRVL